MAFIRYPTRFKPMGRGKNRKKPNVGSDQFLGMVAMEMIVGRKFGMDFTAGMFSEVFMAMLFMPFVIMFILLMLAILNMFQVCVLSL